MSQKEPQNITPQERSRRFQLATRQNYQMLAQQTVYSGASNMRFELPKTRFLSKFLIQIKAKLKIKHASETTVPVDEFTPYKLIQSLNLDLNNGWKPYDIGGRQLALLNAIRLNPSIVFPQSTNPSGYCYLPELTASPTGAENEISFHVELPVTTNDRDTMGIILLQTQDMLCTLNINYANGNAMVDNAAGYEVQISEISTKVLWESFSVPGTPLAYPDISVMKIVNSRTEMFTGSGANTLRLPTGTVYRKLAFYITDEHGVPFEDDDFTSDLMLTFNQTDTNYAVDASCFRALNELQLGYALPKGCFVFDFSNNGVPNYGGTRDFIDTTALSEFWLRFHSKKAGVCHVVMEQLSQLV